MGNPHHGRVVVLRMVSTRHMTWNHIESLNVLAMIRRRLEKGSVWRTKDGRKKGLKDLRPPRPQCTDLIPQDALANVCLVHNKHAAYYFSADYLFCSDWTNYCLDLVPPLTANHIIPIQLLGLEIARSLSARHSTLKSMRTLHYSCMYTGKSKIYITVRTAILCNESLVVLWHS